MSEEKLKIEANEAGVWISALAEKPTQLMVHDFLRAHGVKRYDEGAIDHFLRSQNQTPVKIAPRSPADEQDALITVQLARDNMSASVTVEPPFFKKPWPKRQDILNAMSAKAIIFGVDEEAVGKIADLCLAYESVVVAKGRPPENGRNSWIEVLVDPAKAPEVDESADVIDHRMRSAFVNVHKGDRIAVKHPATQGTEGTSVVGTVLPAKPGKDTNFPAGNGLAPSESDELSLVATIDGRLVSVNDKLQVMPELEVEGDVDFGVGNINFTGVVKIKGAVREGFHVISDGNIEIRETVEGAHVESSGDIVIYGGVRGMNKARIVAAGSVTMGFADQANIVSGVNVYVKNALLHSVVTAQNSVIVTGGQKSQIAGGRIEAGVEVNCQILGSEMGTKTEVTVGLPPALMLRKKELQEQFDQHSANMSKIESNLGFLKKLEAMGQLDAAKRGMMMSATKMKFQLQAALAPITTELEDIKQRLEMSRAMGIVRVKDICYPGVHILIRGVVYVVREAFKFSAFIFEDGEVRLRPFDHKL